MLRQIILKVLRKCLIPAAAIVESNTKTVPQIDDDLCRPSELPLYTIGNPLTNQICPIPDAETPAFLQSAIKTARETVTKYSEEVQVYKRVGGEQLDKSKEQLDGFLGYLQEEDNNLPKAGAIGIGALTGLIFGLRGGFVKKTIYATSGALGMAAVCYPREATEYSKMAIAEAKKYFTMAYSVAYGEPEETKQVIQEAETQKSVEVKDPLGVVTKSHDTAIAKSCHCPVGACFHSEEGSGVPPPSDVGVDVKK